MRSTSRWPSRPTARPTRTAARGISRPPRPVPTRRSRRSSSGRRAGPRRAAGSPRRPRSCAGRSRSPAIPRAASTARSPPLRPASTRVRSTRRSGCSPPPGRGTSATSRTLGRTCCTRSWPTPRTAGATRRRCCCGPRASSRRSTSGSRARHISTPGAPRCSPGSWRPRAACATSRTPSPPRRRPKSRGRPTCSWTASRWPSRTGAPPRCRCCAAPAPRSPAPRSRQRRSCAGAGWRPAPRPTCGTSTRA